MRALVVAGMILMIAGCAARAPKMEVRERAQATATRPVDPAQFTLSEIEPAPKLGEPSTRPAGDAPLEAIQLYAQAREAQLRGDRTTAGRLAEGALKLDPDSFELNFMVGQLLMPGQGASERSIAALEKAAAIRPDHLEVHLHLGRQYLAKGNMAKATEHLRLALLTEDYKHDAESAAAVNLYLARALQQAGYDIAALDQYEHLLSRLGRLRIRTYPELYYIQTRPEIILMQMGELNEKHGRYAQALEQYKAAAESEPNNFDYQSHVVHALMGLKRFDEAKSMAADLVSGHRASTDSVELLRVVFRESGDEARVVEELRRVLKKRGGDRSILFALAQTLDSMGKSAEAEKALTDVLNEKPDDTQLVRRLFDFRVDKGRTREAAVLVVETTARRPDALAELEEMWDRLMRSGTKNRLRLPGVMGLEVSPASDASKQYWISRTAEALGRDTVARAHLEKAVEARPIFGPAYLELLNKIVGRRDWSEKQKDDAAKKLVTDAEQNGRKELAAEMRGLWAMQGQDFKGAIAALTDAEQLGNRSPGVAYAKALALGALERPDEANQLLWKIAGEHPGFEEAYRTLFAWYANRAGRDARAREQAQRVLSDWLATNPFSVRARLIQFNAQLEQRRIDQAEQTITNLMRDHPDSAEVVGSMSLFYARTNRLNDFIRKMEEERKRMPTNRTVANALVQVYTSQKRISDAMGVLNDLRTAVAGDADEMYFVAHLYEQIDRRDLTEAVMRDILDVDGRHAPANNDLGYMLADAGRNLSEAESMIRVAVEAEPENPAYLDSLGWVLYKRGKFEEAGQHLKRATAVGDRPDPVVLDHYADALYRLKQAEEAQKVWKRTLEDLKKLGGGRDDLKALRLEVERKLRQHSAGETVKVAPTVAEASLEAVKN